ncbi:tetratricopeptide repeat protein [Marinobacterium weihaiense]|uniref:DUF560 domain-containing protein n=1 Tax=Marinobacterium weihaiense TaxID=2851016 RepID=A0ABS6M7N1_9GAMM|nr:hypothetical protein [Marinobacterium weihaiense]MBV0932296.1 hypothetical protein [Marinobacterium weihaiense]
MKPALALLLGLLFSQSAWALDCDPRRLDTWQQQINHFSAQQQWSQAYAAALRLSRCQPQRGDLQIELLRLALRNGDTAAALRHRQWLVAHRVPPALLQLVDTWFANGLANAQADAQAAAPTPRRRTGMITSRLGLRLTRGYDSNANDGSRHDSIAINLNGLPLTWDLGANSQQRASTFSAFSLNWQHQARRTWNLGGSARHYDTLGNSEFRLYALLNQPIPCPAGLNCTLDASLNGLRQAQQERLQTQLGISLLGRDQRTSLYARHTRDSAAPDSQSLGLQWLGRVHPRALLMAGAEYDRPEQPRAGGAKASLHLGTRLTPLPGQPLELNLIHLREYEREAYSTGFWGEDRRDRRLSRIGARYQWPLTRHLSLHTRLQWRHTDSPLALYQQHGWLAELTLGGSF